MQAKAHSGTSFAVRQRSKDVATKDAKAEDHETNHQRNHAALGLLRQWLNDESGYDEETWPQLEKAMADNRRSASRKLFHG